MLMSIPADAGVLPYGHRQQPVGHCRSRREFGSAKEEGYSPLRRRMVVPWAKRWRRGTARPNSQPGRPKSDRLPGLAQGLARLASQPAADPAS